MLSESEQLVLYGLTRYPTLNDRELGERLGISKWSVNKIRHRLLDGGYFRALFVPRFEYLGAECLIAATGRASEMITVLDHEAEREMSESILGVPELFLLATEHEQGFALAYARNLTAIKRLIHRFQSVHDGPVVQDNFSFLVYALPLCRIYRYFDFSLLLHEKFDLDIPYDATLAAGERPELTTSFASVQPLGSRTEALSVPQRRVIVAMTEAPTASDAALGERLGLSRHKVARTRHELLERELIRPIVVVDLQKLGFEVLGLFRVQMRSNFVELARSTAIEVPKYNPNLVFSLQEGLEFFLIGVFETFGAVKRAQGELTEFIRRYQLFSAEPLFETFSIPDLKYWCRYRFGLFARHLLGV